jgi:hypothetical protein
MTNKPNSLEDRIKEYLIQIRVSELADCKKLAHVIALICKIEDQYNYCDLVLKNSELEKETADLKAKLDNVKYLDRDKVSKIFNKLITAKMLSTLLAIKSNPEQWHNVTDYENCINAICSLALPVIDKEGIIKIMNKKMILKGFQYKDRTILIDQDKRVKKIAKEYIEKIANEILNNKE